VPPERHLSYDDFWEHVYRETPRPLAFRATTKDEWERWRAALRTKVQELLGTPRTRVPLRAEVLERVDCGNYVRERVIYDTEPSASVTAYVLAPKGRERRPAMLCLHGHAQAGKDVMANVSGWNLRRRRAIWRFNKDLGVRFASRGYVCLCPDARGWGERDVGFFRTSARDPRDPFDGKRDPCNMHFLKAQLFGMNLQWLNTWDDMRGLDYLASRDDVDADRIGAVGFSYGGTRVLYASALDERIKAADISAYLSSFYTYALKHHDTCGSQTVPGILNWCEMGDIAALIGPRPLLCESGEKDPLFPVDEARRAFETIRRCYEVAGVPERCEHEVFKGGHMFASRRAFAFMNRWLRDRDPHAS
jgi:dienelactone hydrolase